MAIIFASKYTVLSGLQPRSSGRFCHLLPLRCVVPGLEPKPTPAAMARSISARATSGFVRAVRRSAGTPARSNRDRLLLQLSGRNSRNASTTGTSPRAKAQSITAKGRRTILRGPVEPHRRAIRWMR